MASLSGAPRSHAPKPCEQSQKPLTKDSPRTELQRLTDELLEHADVIPLADERHTTRDLLTHEQALLDLAESGRDAQLAVLAPRFRQRRPRADAPP